MVCVRYFRFISPYSIHNVVADNLIGCKPRMDHNEDFSEVATYLRGVIKVFELVQSSRDAMLFLICTGCSRLRVFRVYAVVRVKAMAQSMKVEARHGDTNSRGESLSYPCCQCGCTRCRISGVVRRKGRTRALWPRKAQKSLGK